MLSTSIATNLSQEKTPTIGGFIEISTGPDSFMTAENYLPAEQANHLEDQDFGQILHTLADRTACLEQAAITGDPVLRVLEDTCVEKAEAFLDSAQQDTRNSALASIVCFIQEGMTAVASQKPNLRELLNNALLVGKLLNTAIHRFPDMQLRLRSELYSQKIKDAFKNIRIPKRFVMLALSVTLLAPSLAGCGIMSPTYPVTQPIPVPQPIPIPQVGPIPAVIDPVIAVPQVGDIDLERVDTFFQIPRNYLDNKEPCKHQQGNVEPEIVEALENVRNKLLNHLCGPGIGEIDILDNEYATSQYIYVRHVLRERSQGICYANVPDELLTEIIELYLKCADQGWPKFLDGVILE